MKDNVRACVAYIAARLITECEFGSIYDCSRNRDFYICGCCDHNKIEVRDTDHGTVITGSSRDGKVILYNHEDSHYIEINISNHMFEGYDRKTNCHFSGEIDESSVLLYDYEDSGHFAYIFPALSS